MALTYTPPGDLGWNPTSFQLPGVDGRTHSLEQLQGDAGVRAAVIVFMCNHCPYVIAVQERLNAFAKEFRAKGVALVGINSNDPVRYPDDSMDEMKVRAKEQGYVFPYLQDETQEVARAYGAVCTPDFFLFGRGKSQRFELVYRGRMDDNWKNPAQVKVRDLADATEALLAGRPITATQHPSMGCSIKWK